MKKVLLAPSLNSHFFETSVKVQDLTFNNRLGGVVPQYIQLECMNVRIACAMSHVACIGVKTPFSC